MLTHNEAGAFPLLEFLSQVLKLVLEGLAGVFVWLDFDFVAWAGWSLLPPHSVNEILPHGLVASALLLDLFRQLTRVGYALLEGLVT